MSTKTITKEITIETTENQTQKNNPDIQTLSKRDIGRITEVILWTVAGGRCEFCNKYLLEDWLTLTKGKYGQNAHIVGFKQEAARGKIGERPQNIHDVSNLMLLCYEHHRLVDNIQPENYPCEKLELIKRTHEESIKRLTEITPNQTFVIRFQSKIGGDCVGISDADIRYALEPFFYPKEKQLDINLTQFDDRLNGFFDNAKSEIKNRVARIYDSQIDSNPIEHISVFAFAPMALLIFLGASLSNKIRVDLYQRHRDTEDWKWKTEGQIVEYEFSQLRHGTAEKNVALILSLSGKIDVADISSEIDESFSIYEITLKDTPLSPMLFGMRESLDGFKNIYQIALGTIKANHGNIQAINLFPAVPAPIAVLCGKELLPKVHPEIWIYDNDKRNKNKGFNLILKVNEYDR